MSRQIVLDTETTGLEAAQHSIIEVGCLEIFERRLTGRSWHQFINPGRAIDEGAVAVHGITQEQLRDKPRFPEVADELLEFLGDAELVIHNADFDMGFLAAEFARCGRSADWPPPGEVIDTLRLAREKHPGQRNSLDALCKRYEVDNSGRDLHGALLDAGLLAEVYLRMTGGQNELGLRSDGERRVGYRPLPEVLAALTEPLPIIAADDSDRAAHAAMLSAIAEESGACLWLEQEQGEDAQQ